MEIPILIEPTVHNAFRASSGAPLNLSIEAPTRDEALTRLRKLIEDRVASGAEMVTLQIGSQLHPLAAFAGGLKGDPLLESWKNAITEYRDQQDSAAGKK